MDKDEIIFSFSTLAALDENLFVFKQIVIYGLGLIAEFHPVSATSSSLWCWQKVVNEAYTLRIQRNTSSIFLTKWSGNLTIDVRIRMVIQKVSFSEPKTDFICAPQMNDKETRCTLNIYDQHGNIQKRFRFKPSAVWDLYDTKEEIQSLDSPIFEKPEKKKRKGNDDDDD